MKWLFCRVVTALVFQAKVVQYVLWLNNTRLESIIFHQLVCLVWCAIRVISYVIWTSHFLSGASAYNNQGVFVYISIYLAFTSDIEETIEPPAHFCMCVCLCVSVVEHWLRRGQTCCTHISKCLSWNDRW